MYTPSDSYGPRELEVKTMKATPLYYWENGKVVAKKP